MVFSFLHGRVARAGMTFTRKPIVVAASLALSACQVSIGDPAEAGTLPRDGAALDAQLTDDGSVDGSVADANSTNPDATGNTGGSGGTDGGSTSSTDVWRPFSDDSPWNTPIGADPALAPDSEALITDFRFSSQWGEHLDVNIDSYSIPVYYVDASTPTVQVVCDIGGQGFVGNAGFDATAEVPIPVGALPAEGSDGHLAIVDTQRNIEWGLWNARNEGGAWACGLGATSDLTGSGVRPYKPDNGATWYESHGARACGFPLVAGLIRADEIEAGVIDHALVVAYPHIRSGFYMYPATTAQAGNGIGAQPDRGIPCGGRIQLDPDYDVEALGLSPAGLAIARALQKYGAYVGDYSGALSLYAESAADERARLDGLLDTYELRDRIDLSRLRVIEWGTLTDDGNG